MSVPASAPESPHASGSARAAGELLRRLAREIEKTRRRVNALEYVMIPGITVTKKVIEGKLEEADRSSRVRLMKVKEILEARGM